MADYSETPIHDEWVNYRDTVLKNQDLTPELLYMFHQVWFASATALHCLITENYDLAEDCVPEDFTDTIIDELDAWAEQVNSEGEAIKQSNRTH